VPLKLLDGALKAHDFRKAMKKGNDLILEEKERMLASKEYMLILYLESLQIFVLLYTKLCILGISKNYNLWMNLCFLFKLLKMIKYF